MADVPTVMVSSTFYDLSQVRRDLRDFIADEMGYRPLLSEYSSFPIDPDATTVENCRRRVTEDATILVLIVGGRYGSTDIPSNKSITNLEYLTARAKGIPIYSFILKNILSVLPLWEHQPDADYSPVVASNRVFEFVTEVRTTNQVWAFPFESAQDIIQTLRTQWAYLFSEGLQRRLQLNRVRAPAYLAQLGTRSLRLVLERPPGWEQQLFLTALADEVARCGDALRDYDSGLRLGLAEDVPAPQALDWMQTRLHELTSIAHSASTLFNVEFSRAMGPAGQPADIEHTLWVARRVADALQEAVDWTLRVRRARVAPPFDSPVNELLAFSAHLIQEFRRRPQEWLDQFTAAAAASTPGNNQVLHFGITLEIGDEAPFLAAMERAAAEYARQLQNPRP